MAHAAHPIGNMSPCPTPALETKYTAAAIPKPKPIPVSTGSATGKPMERFSQQHLFVRDLPEGQETDPFDDQAIRKVRDILKSCSDSIGPYRILEKVGTRGMREVYRVEQRTPIRREVALKLINPPWNARD